MLTAAGVEPLLVEWFGRWGAAAVRAYVEDARATAPETSTLALRVADMCKFKTTLTILDKRVEENVGEQAKGSEAGNAVVEPTVSGSTADIPVLPTAGGEAILGAEAGELIVGLVEEQFSKRDKEVRFVSRAFGKTHVVHLRVH